MSALEIEIADEQTALEVDPAGVCRIIRLILENEGVGSAAISVAVVDDPTIHQLNCKYLEHDYPTDVLSFVLEQVGSHLEGEVIVSSDTAIRQATEYSVDASAELMLYIVHGTLHLVGYNDKTDDDRVIMRSKEQFYMEASGWISPGTSLTGGNRSS